MDPRVEKYKQLVANGVDPQRAKSLLQQAQATQKPALSPMVKGAGGGAMALTQAQPQIQVQQPTVQPQQRQPFGQYLKSQAQETFRAPVGVLQGLSDVGQRTVGRAADWIGKGIAEKVTGRKLFSQERMTEGNIMPMVLGEQAETGMAKFGRGVGQALGTAALTAPIGAAAGSIVKAGGAVSKIGGFLRGAAAGAPTGAIGTQIGSLATRDKFASAGETAIGAVAGGLLGGVMGAKAVGKARKLASLLGEKETSRNIEKAAEQGRIKFKQGLFKTGEGSITPSERVANAQKVIQKEIKGFSTKDPQKLINQIDGLGKQKYTELAEELKKMNVGTMTKDKASLTKQMGDILKDSEWKKFFASPSKQNQINEVMNSVKNAKTADDLWNARINLDKLMPQSVKSPTGTNFQADTLHDVWMDIRTQMNNTLDDIVVKQGGEGVKSKFYDMSSLLEAKSNLIKNIPAMVKGSTTSLGRMLGIGTAGAGGIGIASYIGTKAANKAKEAVQY